ncbi:hypothetical protein I7I50_11981 [Histoplasma capsulatum G186AR]|uniref:Uncharacterized protein n=1 Tax=Ajellomyces capsulatus TaxID=5037 RepID=A0A8H7YDE4_AJECA|nr:hypothetical protein I7I52_11672 [Histoplasma capsulatum]QSS70372.1 hypothetical protein I7I50_11981 [Histoplasma capsulatum G186AR]
MKYLGLFADYRFPSYKLQKKQKKKNYHPSVDITKPTAITNACVHRFPLAMFIWRRRISVLLILVSKLSTASPWISAALLSKTSTSKISSFDQPFFSRSSFTAFPPDRVSLDTTKALIASSVIVGPNGSEI